MKALGFRGTLNNLRREIVRQMAIISASFSFLIAYFFLADSVFRPRHFFAMLGLGFIILLIERLNRKSVLLGRFMLMMTLNLACWLTIILSPLVWMPLLALPLILVSSMLVSHSGFLTAFIVLGLTAFLETVLARGYALGMISLIILLDAVVVWRTMETFFIALMWYSSMQQEADRLLEQTREHRAELAQAVKSLNNANQTQRRMQQQLIRARKSAEEARRLKERFAANISHELRTPLNLILGFSEVMYVTPEVYGDLPFPPKLRRDIYQIHRSSRHLLDMIDDILDLSHVEMSHFTIHLEETDLSQFFSETIEIAEGLFRGKSVELKTHIAPNLPLIEIDRTRMRQVIINLLTNAQRFTQKGYVLLSVEQVNLDVVCRITDTGVGIPADKISQIFDEFFQVDYSLSRSHGGAGLGLAITKRFVEAHNGIIWVDSVEGEGSTFSFTLPIRERRKSVPMPSDHWWDMVSNTKQAILVIDPDQNVGTMIQRYLDDYEVYSVSDQREISGAIELYRPRAIIHNVPAEQTLPLLDLSHAIPYIQCTLPSKRWMIEQLNVLDYLAKPITGRELLARIEQINEVDHILVVDDDRGFVQLVERILETQHENWQVSRAYDGNQALEIVKATPPSLILLDLAMPGLDGFQFLNQLQALNLNIPVILLTATSYIDDDQKHYGRLFLQQPGGLNPTEVLNCLRAIVHEVKPRYALT